ncbi:hypothetical protein HYV50_02705 [Candidatus Pacearchaeota archaeon]|nr:hypothetical protein [Candidatus Pacearchaeota archaeon]
MRSSIIGFFVIALTVFSMLIVSADPVEKTEGFVCPVFNSNSAVGEHNPNAVQIGQGDYSVIGPDVSVPVHATNGDGAGTPGGEHSSPGDSDYSAAWSG